jgi:hypothetical protein
MEVSLILQKAHMNLLIHKAIWLLVVFWPPLYNLFGLNTGQIIYTLVVTSFVLFCAMSYMAFRGSRMNDIIFPTLMALSASIYFSLVTLVNADMLLVWRDVIEVLRPVLYLVFFLFPAFVPLDEEDLDRLMNFLIKVVFLASAVDVLAFFNVFEPLVRMYRPGSFEEFNYHRFSGTFGYAYSFAFLLLFFLLYLLQSGKSLVRHRIVFLFFFPLFIFLTGSRTALLTLIFVVVYYIFAGSSNARMVIWRMTKVVVILALFSSVLYNTQVELISKNIEYAQKLLFFFSGSDTDYSPTARLEQLKFGLSHLEGFGYLIGVGSAKGAVPGIENIYGHYLVKWGMIGFAMYFGHLAALYAVARPRQCHSEGTKTFLLSFRVWLFVVPIIGFSAPITDAVKLFCVFYLISGYVYQVQRRLNCISVQPPVYHKINVLG